MVMIIINGRFVNVDEMIDKGSGVVLRLNDVVVRNGIGKRGTEGTTKSIMSTPFRRLSRK